MRSPKQVVILCAAPNPNKCMIFYKKKLPSPKTHMIRLLRNSNRVILLLVAGLLLMSARSFGQRVTLVVNKAPLTKVFKEIRKQTGYDFFYTDKLIANAKPVTLNVHDEELSKVLDECFSNQPLTYSIENKIIIIHEKVQDETPVKKGPGKTISGMVVDSRGNMLAGVTVREKGKKPAAAVTNNEGRFFIQVDDDDAVLLFTSIGFEETQLPVSKITAPLVVTLHEGVSNLDQVQVIAYGTTTKRFNTGDVTTVTAEDIAKNPVNNVLEALQGKIPGLFIQQATGQPGSAFSIRLRDQGNFAVGATPPLVVVDGVRYPAGTLPLSSNTSYGTATFLQGGSGLNYLNPNDIESISVLKDADATALYGSSGAYGVILITTKKAKPSPPTLNANVYTGVSVNGETTPLLNTQQYLMLRREAITNSGGTIGSGDLDLNGTWPTDRYTDWKKIFMGDYAATTNADLSYSGGSQNSNYLISGSYRNNGNIQRHKGSDGDGTLRFALNTSTNDKKLTVSLSGTYVSSLDDMVPYDFSTGALTPPNAPPAYNPDGSVDWNSIGTNVNSSGVAGNANRIYKNVTNNLLANATIVYKPFSKLTLRGIIGYDDINGKENIEYPTTTMDPSTTNAAAQTHSIFHHYEDRSLTISPYAEFHSTLGSKGDLTVKLGSEIDNLLSYYDEISGTGFPTDAFLGDPATGSVVTTDYNETPYRSIGSYGIIKYIWDQKYIIDLNGRRDGSIKFGPGRRFGNFGSVALGWIFSEEKAVKENLPFLSFGKLRASTGVLGGDAISNFAYLSTYSVIGGTYAGGTGIAPNSIPDSLLAWERDRESEIGLELGFLHDRIYVEGDYYYNKASNQLVNQPLSTVTGFSGYSLNSDAIIRTSGWEMSLSADVIKGKNFSWNVKLNASIPSSKLLKVPSQRNPATNYILNEPITGILLYKYNGVDPATGNYSFTKANGQTGDFTGGLAQVDKTQFIDLAPKYFGGFQNAIAYKSLSFDFSITFTNREGKNFLGQTAFPFGLFGLNGATEWLRRWQKPGDITDIPKVTASLADFGRQQLFQSSTGAYSDATYARLQNVSIRYRFPDMLAKKMCAKSLTVYLQGQNLLTVSKLGGLDPENLAAGVIPPLRVFTAGLNVTF